MLSKELGLKEEPLGCTYMIQTPSDGELLATHRCENEEVKVDGEVLRENLTLLPLKGFDMILGMDWLSNHRAQVYCQRILVKFSMVGVILQGLQTTREKSILVQCAIKLCE